MLSIETSTVERREREYAGQLVEAKTPKVLILMDLRFNEEYTILEILDLNGARFPTNGFCIGCRMSRRRISRWRVCLLVRLQGKIIISLNNWHTFFAWFGRLRRLGDGDVLHQGALKHLTIGGWRWRDGLCEDEDVWGREEDGGSPQSQSGENWHFLPSGALLLSL